MKVLVSILMLIVSLKAAAIDLKVNSLRDNETLKSASLGCYDVHNAGKGRTHRYTEDLKQLNKSSFVLPLEEMVDHKCEYFELQIFTKQGEETHRQYAAHISDEFIVSVLDSEEIYLSQYDQDILMDDEHFGDAIVAWFEEVDRKLAGAIMVWHMTKAVGK